MEVKKKAFEIAREFHDGKIRKAEPEKDFILHPISVANKLYKTGFKNDDNVIAAALLHDVVEDTSCTREFIYKEFGSDIGSLVDGVSEEDTTLPWRIRKQATISKLKCMDLRHKIIKGADAWDNTEDLMIKFGKSGIRDFSSFNSGPDKKLWYWNGLYESLIHEQDKNTIAFYNFRENIDTIFEPEKFEKLDEIGKLYYKKLELYKLRDIIGTIDMINRIKKRKKTYVVSIFNNNNVSTKEVYNYLIASGFQAKLLEIDVTKLMDKKISNIESQIDKYSYLGYDLVLLDINLFLLYRLYLTYKFNKDDYYNCINYWVNKLVNNSDKIIGLNTNNIFDFSSQFGKDNCSMVDTSILISNEIVEDMRNKYLKDIKVRIKN